ncbi:DUF1775 domain-containing protein [Streptomyces sp. SDr-06]|uniref:YcnI family copper-binding membrane protein n=1 Tax=Streptomyces sp. SDr-06 TaxID=2267702 RepID=UPI001CB8B55F
MRSSRCAHQAAAVLGTAAGALLLFTGSASAHVRVFSEGAKEGSAATLRFRVPSEKPDATTVRVDVTLPAGVTCTGSPPVPGWTAEEIPASGSRTAHLVWTATAGNELTPDQHRDFEVRVGPLPKKPSIAFDVAQTYSDGSVASWNQPPTGVKAPEFPAPVLVLDATAADAEKARRDMSALPMPAPTATATPAEAAGQQETGVAPWLRWAAAGAVALSAGAIVVVHRRTVHDTTGAVRR